MSTSLLADAFRHHAWATRQVIDACLALTPDQMETSVPGTFGSISETVRHMVSSDAWYLFTLTDDRSHLIDGAHLGLPEPRAVVERNDAAWSLLLNGELDPDSVLTEVDDDDGYQKRAPIGIRLAQALHHGTDHRSQICTALTALGLEPPAIDAWDFGIDEGRTIEFRPLRT